MRDFEEEIIEKLRDNPEVFLRALREINPALYTVAILNVKMLELMKFGEIILTEIVYEGKIKRVEAVPKISKNVIP